MQLRNSSPIPGKIILGTAQLGFNYGANKDDYQVTYERAEGILNAAYYAGIRAVDTAVGYGKSHDFLKTYHSRFPSRKFQVYTKISLIDFKNGEYLKLCDSLGVTELEGLMLHSSLESENVQFVEALKGMRNQGTVKKLGLSLYYDSDFYQLINDFEPDFVQLPFNVLDNELLRNDQITFLKNKNISIQSRSTFMRGVLANPEGITFPAGLKPQILSLIELSKKREISPLSLCLNYSCRNSLIDNVVIGIDSVEQLEECLESMKENWSTSLKEEILSIKVDNPDLVDLRKWS